MIRSTHGIIAQSKTRIEQELGVIYNATSFSDLNDFTNTGSGAVINNGAIRFSTGAINYNKYIVLNPIVSSLDNFKLTARIKLIALGWGVGLGLRSVNGWSPAGVVAQFSFDTTSKGGMYFINNQNGGTAKVSNVNALPSIQLNDILDLILERNSNVFTMSIVNQSRAGSATLSYTYSYPLSISTANLLPNTYKLQLHEIGGTQDIISLKYESTEKKNNKLTVIGDSKVAGYVANTKTGRFAEQLNNNYPTTVISAGQSDRSAEVLARINEIKQFNSDYYLIQIGRNDVKSGTVTSTQLETNLIQIDNELRALGANVLFTLPFPESDGKITTLKNIITANFPGRYIDCETPFLFGSGLDPAYTTDGIHLNQAGNDLAYNVIKNSGKII